MLDAEDRTEALKKVEAVAAKLDEMKLAKAAAMVREDCIETLSYYSFPEEHWPKVWRPDGTAGARSRIRTNNGLERIMREIRRRTRVVGNFPDGNSALMLAAARLRHIAGTTWSERRYLDMKKLRKKANRQTA